MSTVSNAAVIDAASCSLTDVQNAVNTAVSGDTVQLPNCTQTTWNGTVNINKRLLLKGNGTSSTVIQRSRVSAGFNTNVMFRVTNVVGFEMTAFTLDGTRDTDESIWEDFAIVLENCVDFRVHHMVVSDFAVGIWVTGDPLVMKGVIDNNTFNDNYYSTPEGSLGYGVSINGNGTYPTLALGTIQNTFIEDNTFARNRHAIASNNGARYVFRHNTVTDNRENAALVDAHGRTASWPRGTRQYEIYENLLNDLNSTSQFAGIGPRGGDGVIFNNTIAPMSSNREIHLMNDTFQGCAGTYPLLDQIRELYIWDNLLTTGGAARITTDCGTFIQQNRDYFLAQKSGYAAFTYPHPLVSTAPPGPDITSNLALRIGFEEGSGSTASDTSGNGRNATLSGAFTWQPGIVGNSAIQFNGTAAHGLITGLMGSPASITLAAQVQIITPNVNGGTVINIGDYVGFRVYDNRIRGFYWNGGSHVGLDYFLTYGGGYRSIVYIHNGSAHKLYVDGVLVASSGASAISWTALSANSYVGKHPNSPSFDLSGRVDELRVYSRELSATDIAALPSAGTTGVSVSLVSPVSGGTFNTTSSSIGFTGTSIDTNGSVSSVTYTCTNSCSPKPAVSGTTGWSITGVGLQLGTTVFTFTATDNEGNQAFQSLTVVRTDPSPPPVVAGCTHFGSNSGSGTRSGANQSNTMQIANFLAIATPGKTLCLADGNYSGGSSLINWPSTLNGTSSQPITIKALNEGKVLINGNGTRPINLLGSWCVIEGINVKQGDNATVSMRGNDCTIRRVIAWNDTGVRSDAHTLDMAGNRNTAEDCAIWGVAEKFLTMGSNGAGTRNNRVRRCWIRGESAGSIASSASSHNGVEQGYGQDGSIYENVLVTWNRTGTQGDHTGNFRSFRTWNSKSLGILVYMPIGSVMGSTNLISIVTDAGSPQQHGDYHATQNTQYRDLVGFVQPGHAQFGSMRGMQVVYQGPGPRGSGNSITNALMVGGATSTTSSSDYAMTGIRTGTSLSAALSGSGHSNIWTLMPGLCKRYVNGTLTTEGLWPWVMNQRIKDGLVQSGRASYDVTAHMETLFGTIPTQCRTSTPTEPPTPPPPVPVATSISFVGSNVLNTKVCPEKLSTFQVRVLDQNGSLYTESNIVVSASFEANPGLASLNGELGVLAESGIATFDNLCVTEPGDGYELKFSSGALNVDTSNVFNITEDPVPSNQAFQVEPPRDTRSGGIFENALVVKVVDQTGNVIVGNTAEVTLSIASGPPGVSLSGTLVKNAVNGVVTFDDVIVNGRGEGIVLKVESTGIATQLSAPFRSQFRRGIVPKNQYSTGVVVGNRR